MVLFKLSLYSLIMWISVVGLPIHAEPTTDSNPTVSTTLTPQWFEEQQSLVDKLKAALEPARAALQAEEQAFPKNVEGLITIEKITPEMLEEVAQKKHAVNQKLEELRVERKTAQDNLDKQTANLTKLQTSLEEFTKFPRAELTVDHNQKISVVEKDIALHKQVMKIEKQYLGHLKVQNEVVIKQAIIATDWQGQLKNERRIRLFKEQSQAIVHAQEAFEGYKEELETNQKNLPAKIVALETTDATLDILKGQTEKAILDKQSVEVQVKKLDLEHQTAENNLENESESITEQEKKLESLRKTPPVEAEQEALHEKRIAVLENAIEQKKKRVEMVGQWLVLIKQRIEQANKRLALAIEWNEKLQAVSRFRQKKELAKQIRQEQQRYLNLAAELSQKLELIPALAENSAQRYLLEMQIQEANELAQRAMRQSKTSYLNEQIQQWQKTAEEHKEATDVYQSQLENIKAIITELDTLLQDIQVRQMLLESKITFFGEQQAIAKEQASTLSGQSAQDFSQAQKLLSKLKASLQRELNKIPPLLKKGNKLQKLLEEVYTTNTYRALLRQRKLPSSMAEWQNIFVEIGSVPILFFQQLQLAGRGFKQAFEQTSKQNRLIIGIATLIWLSFVIFLSTLYSGLSRVKKRSHFVEQAIIWLHLWRLNAISIAITGVFLLLIWLAQPNKESTFVALILLLAWLVTKLLVNLSGLLLAPKTKLSGFAFSMPNVKSQEMTKLHQQIRWIVIGLGILIVTISFIHQEPEGKLSLKLLDLVDSVFMVLLALTIPLFMRVRGLILNHLDGYWRLVTNIITLLLPLIILVVSILGVTGYVVLGWTIAKYLSLSLLVLSAWFIGEGLISVLTTLWKKSALQRGESGSLWAEDLIPLIQNLLGLALIGLAVVMFLWLTGWYEDVAIKESVGKVFNFALVTFDSGNQIKLIDVLLAAFIIWVVFWFGGWSRRISYRLVYLNITDSGIRNSLSVFTQYVVIVIGLLIALKTIGIYPTALTMFAGAIGVGLGFGMQNVVNNFVSGILLLVERPVKVGDTLDVSGYTEVLVKNIGIRSTIVETKESKELMIPNSQLISKHFVNWTYTDQVICTRLYVSISHDYDPHVVEKIIKKVLDENTEILSKPKCKVVLYELNETSMKFRFEYSLDLRYASETGVKSALWFKLWDSFKEAGISMKVPQLEQGVPLK
ncbi:MAG: mechanosensitive ion channel [Thiomargarita sp.]|nr:mechanosensitive ion channel [Thiomargarita sp.]